MKLYLYYRKDLKTRLSLWYNKNTLILILFTVIVLFLNVGLSNQNLNKNNLSIKLNTTHTNIRNTRNKNLDINTINYKKDQSPKNKLKPFEDLSLNEIQNGYTTKIQLDRPSCLHNKSINSFDQYKKDSVLSKCLLEYIFSSISLIDESRKCVYQLGKIHKGYYKILKLIILYTENNRNNEYYEKLKPLIDMCGSYFYESFIKTALTNNKLLKKSIIEFIRPKLI